MYNCGIIPVVLYHCTTLPNHPLYNCIINSPPRSPKELFLFLSVVESAGVLRDVAGLLQVWDFRFLIDSTRNGEAKDAIWEYPELVTGGVMPGQCTASVPLAENQWLRQWVAWAINMLVVRSGHGQQASRMRWSKCCIIHLVLYNIVRYYTT